MNSQITINCEIELHLKNTYQNLISTYCYTPQLIESNEACIKLMYNLWMIKLNYNRFCKNT